MIGSSVLILGEGQLGTALALCAPSWARPRVVGHGELDLADRSAIAPLIAACGPSVVINAAGWTQVDRAEEEPEAAFAVNAVAVGEVARAATRAGAVLVQVSSDFVFSGREEDEPRTRPYGEEDGPQPLSIYGASKLAGEHMALAYADEVLVVRTSGVFGRRERGRAVNFVEAILRAARAGGAPLRVVADQVASPTYAPDLAGAIWALLAQGARGRIHVTNTGEVSWHGFALAIVAEAGLGVPVAAISSAEYGAAARRPAYSALDGTRLRARGVVPPPWRDGLRRYLAARADPRELAEGDGRCGP